MKTGNCVTAPTVVAPDMGYVANVLNTIFQEENFQLVSFLTRLREHGTGPLRSSLKPTAKFTLLHGDLNKSKNFTLRVRGAGFEPTNH